MSEQQADLELVQQVQKGNKTAFDLLVRKYQHRVAKLVSRFVREPADVSDVTQEAFIKAYRGLANFRGDSAFYTWLYRIAVNTAKNHLTNQQRRETLGSIDVNEAEQVDFSAGLRDIATPERNVQRDELRKVIDDTLASLPAELREAITLREFEGMSYEDIADVMSCPIGTVRSRIFRAREAIDKRIKPLLHPTSEELIHG